MTPQAPGGFRRLRRLPALISDLRLAILLLLLIALASAVGTAVPQHESAAFYHELYDPRPWLGLLRGDGVLRLQLDHVYSSGWFLGLLAWLGLSLTLCSWRRQWPALQASLRWVDYTSSRQLSKLSVAESVAGGIPGERLDALASLLERSGWRLNRKEGRLAARKGVAGRIGPLLVHAGLVLLMVGAAWGALGGHRLERFLAPGRDLELLDSRGTPQLTLALDDFRIERDPSGRPEQFRSRLRLLPPPSDRAEGSDPGLAPAARAVEVSVNHPLRHRGMTIYQADWSLAAITLQIGRSPLLQLPLQTLTELGDQVWGLVLPTHPDGTDPVVLTLSSEQGPVDVFGADGRFLTQLTPGGAAREINGLPLRVESILPASGLLLKRDPGVPLVYAGFAVALLGGALSLVATRQLWAIADPVEGFLHVGGLCNRNLPAFAAELPQLLRRTEDVH